jgi:hypothetical protein
MSSPANAGAATRHDHPDPRLRGAVLPHPFQRVWTAARTVASSLPRWSVTASDPRAGEIVAEVHPRLGGSPSEVTIRISLDESGLTRVDLTCVPRSGPDLGASRRRIGRFLARLTRGLERG